MNELPEEQYNDIDDLLAFVSIYDDEKRTAAYFDLLEEQRDLIKDRVCVEAGCGFGFMAERLAQLGAARVYAIEANGHLYELARQRLAPYDNVIVLHQDIRTFMPQERVAILVHEFFGQLLFDEDIHVLDHLRFTPEQIMPNRAILKMSVLRSQDYLDDIVTSGVLHRLRGALVAGLFDDEGVPLQQPVLEWRPGRQNRLARIEIDEQGDLICFGLEVWHDNRLICRAGECDNWSLVWTPRAGDAFALQFAPADRGTKVYFQWINPTRPINGAEERSVG